MLPGSEPGQPGGQRASFKTVLPVRAPREPLLRQFWAKLGYMPPWVPTWAIHPPCTPLLLPTTRVHLSSSTSEEATASLQSAVSGRLTTPWALTCKRPWARLLF